VAKFVMRDATIIVNGINLSDHCSSVDVTDTTDQVEVTSFGSSAYKQYLQGFHDASITASFFGDFAASSTYATLQPLYVAGSIFSVEVRATSAARSATNPAGTLAAATMYQFSPIGGKVGDASTFDVTFANSGTAGLVWATS
jgi:hypothetical protein